MSAVYECRRLRQRFGGREVLNVDHLALRRAEFTVIVGPNGAGKSTLLTILAGLQTGYEGECALFGKDTRLWRRRELARRVSFLPQKIDLAFPFTARQVVMMGRTPHCDSLYDTLEDTAAVREAMRLTDTLEFEDRDYRSLSGGERQRVLVASALAQSCEVLLLDEPATFLDLKHQLAIYRLLGELARQGRAVVAVTHDLNLAAAYADRMIVLYRGKAVADGAAATAMSEDVLRCVFEVDPAETPWIRHG